MNETLHHLGWSGRILAAGLVALGVGWLLRRWPLVAAPFAAIAGVLSMFALAVVVAFLRPVPEPLDQALFEGVEYRRRVAGPAAGRRAVSHVVTIDLSTPGLRVFVTPPSPTRSLNMRWQLAARTTETFLREFDQQLAVNANFYYPQRSNSIFYYYPRQGDGVSPVGRAASNGIRYGTFEPKTRTLWFYDGWASIRAATATASSARQAVAGFPLLIAGREVPSNRREDVRHPSVAAGLDASGRRLTFVVVDGRAPFYSDGVTVVELRDRLHDEGARDAILLDGGGSSTLVWRSFDHGVQVLNLPVHGRMPSGYQRPVANHIGFSGLRPAR